MLSSSAILTQAQTKAQKPPELSEREDCWPTEADMGRPVILPGGEAGLLRSWWHAADGSEWRWSVEFYNHR